MKNLELDDKLKIKNANEDDYIFNIDTAMIYKPKELRIYKDKKTNKIYARYRKDEAKISVSNLIEKYLLLEEGDDLSVLNQKEQKRNKRKLVVLNPSIDVVDGIHPFNKWVVLYLQEVYGGQLIVKDNQTTVTCLRILKNFLCKKAMPHKKLEILFDQLGTNYNNFLEFIRNYKGI